MFDINNARDFYQKEDFDDYMQRPDSARHAMNCAITAHHMADWVWGDFVKGDASPILNPSMPFLTKCNGQLVS